jgi:hypothetical protein
MSPIDHSLAAIALAATCFMCGAVIWGASWREEAVANRHELRRRRLAKSTAVSRGNRTRAARKAARLKELPAPPAEPERLKS